MKRFIEEKLIDWKNKENRKPLLINGIRQVGKTWSIKNFGEKHFDDFLYVNFDLEPNYSDIFKRSKNPQKILFELSILFERKFDPATTLIFFDEIQGSNEALNALKYFCEAPDDYYIIGAGSYLGITFSRGASFPVGKVEMIELKPMTYKEFLIASGQDLLVAFIESIDSIEPISEPIFNKLNDYLREYYLVGGMPEAVKTWAGTRDFQQLENIQENIINAYFRDFSKYPPSNMILKIIAIWDSIVSQLTRENRKFKYSEINKSARAREYENALEWLIAGNYLSKVTMIEKFQLPLKGYENTTHFKVYMPDIGLLRKMSEYPISSLLEIKQNENIQFKGAMAENYVLQEMNATFTGSVYYWAKNGYEMDFVIQMNGQVLPVEIKAGQNVKSKSMTKVLERLDKGIRISMKNLTNDGKLMNIPLVLTSELMRLFNIA
ncbi:MAG: AAA family ATPase [Spirochaetaceae bacterium]|jgi:predicted AAA+ superfamily ATPase|nr:AAA family ATPase [Spirochaetaceae bacterium]